MKPIAKTDFSKLSGAEMAVVGEILEIRSVKTVLGYFVPIERMRLVEGALDVAEADSYLGVADILRGALAGLGEG